MYLAYVKVIFSWVFPATLQWLSFQSSRRDSLDSFWKFLISKGDSFPDC